MQGGLDFRLWIAGIASGQRTCGIDPIVLGSVPLRGVAGAGEAQPPKESVPLTDLYCPAGVAYLFEGLFALLGGVGDMRPDGMRRWEGGTSSI